MPVQCIYEGVSLVFIQVYFETMVNVGPIETLGRLVAYLGNFLKKKVIHIGLVCLDSLYLF